MAAPQNERTFEPGSMDFITNKVDYIRYFESTVDSMDARSDFHEKILAMLKSGKTRLSINLNDLRRRRSPLWSKFLDDPITHIPAFEAAFNDFMTARSDEFDLKRYGMLKETFKLGFDGAFGSRRVNPMNLGSRNITQMMCVEGIVTKVSFVSPKLVHSVHYAENEQDGKRWVQQTYRDPTSFLGPATSTTYPTQTDDGHALSTEFGLCTYEDSQTVYIQDMPERTTAGTMPRTVKCILERDLVDSCKPGDRVQMIGVYRALANRVSGETDGNYTTVMIVNQVKTGQSDSANTVKGDDVRVIKKIAKRKNVFDLLANSIAPSIYGHKYIKKAITLMLVGGNEKNLKNGTHIRGDINILMVGDPSVAKSQILRCVMNTAPLAINTTGRGASGVGLTAAVTQDKLSGERRLEAGAMVLADRGIVCIDEFDKMSDMDRVAIHEVMEQQTVTIAKAGIHTSLNARCSVIAASNPIYGQYDKTRAVHENIALPDSLLSRFDLVFIVLDKLDTEMDRAISDHVLKLHRSRQDNTTNEMYADMDDDDSDDEDYDANDVWENSDVTGVAATMRRRNKKKDKFLKKSFCKKYIEYCKKKIRPQLTDEAVATIAENYARLRETEANGAMPITARCLETIIRLSSAHAKLRLSKKVQEKDVNAVLQILKYALKSSDTSADLNNDEEMAEEEPVVETQPEAMEVDGSKPASQTRRSKRTRNARGPGKRQAGVASNIRNADKRTITRFLANYYRSQNVTEVTVDDFKAHCTEKGKDYDKELIVNVFKQLDAEDKAFYRADKETIAQI